MSAIDDDAILEPTQPTLPRCDHFPYSILERLRHPANCIPVGHGLYTQSFPFFAECVWLVRLAPMVEGTYHAGLIRQCLLMLSPTEVVSFPGSFLLREPENEADQK